MDLSDIEEIYRKDLENSEKIFLDSLNSGINIKEAERKYKDSTNNARIKYASNLSAFLKKSNKYSLNLKKYKSIKTAPFEVDTSDYNLGFYSRTKIKLSLFFFKLGFSLRNIFRLVMPNSILYVYYRIKIRVLRVTKKISNFIYVTNDKIADLRARLKEFLKEKEIILNHNKN